MNAMRARAILPVAVLLAGLSSTGAAGVEYLPVASVTIYPGDVISEAMLTDGQFPSGTSANFPVVVSVNDVAGKVARRTILPGRLIARNAIAEPQLVEKGTVITAVYEDAALLITASVVALQSGALADAIQVRNLDSGKVIVGSVQADGTVRVGGR
jgi:flagella basal body P-ring formation protein FlgA